MLRTFLALAALAVAAQGRMLKYVGVHSTNWKNPANWNGNTPVSDTPASTVIKSLDVAAIVDGTVSVGQSLQLPKDGVLHLRASTTEEVVITFSANNTGSVATYIGGTVRSQDREFECHTNWQTVQGEPVDLPPCGDDVAIIPGDVSVALFSDDYETHVKQLQYDARLFNKDEEGNLPLFMFTPRVNLRINNPSSCAVSSLAPPNAPAANGTTAGNSSNFTTAPTTTTPPVSTRCLCHTTCPAQGVQILQDAQQREVARYEAEMELQRLHFRQIDPVSDGPSESFSASPTFELLPRHMARADVSLAVDDENLDKISAYLAAVLSADAKIGMNVTASDIKLSLDYERIPGQNKPLVEGVKIQWDYVSLCKLQVCTFTQATRPNLYSYIESLLEASLALYTPSLPQCYDHASGWNEDCLQGMFTAGYDACRTTKTRDVCDAQLGDAVREHVLCGASGRHGGVCLQQFDTVAVAVTGRVTSEVVTAAAANQPTTTPAAGGDGDGAGGTGGGAAESAAASGDLPLIPIAAGAGGGALLLIIIIIVLVNRNRNASRGGGAAKADQNRSVVAFENPMYDDPSQAGARDGIEEDSPAADEGLYDEPAFNDAEKTNPLYASNEDLAAAGIADEEEGGYLDVEEGGYLDVAPEDQ